MLLGSHVRELQCCLPRTDKIEFWAEITSSYTNLEALTVIGATEEVPLQDLHCANLKTLYVFVAGLNPTENIMTAFLSQCKKLTKLILFNQCPGQTEKILERVGEWCPLLEEIGQPFSSTTNVNPGLLEALLSRTPNVRRLRFEGSNLDDACVRVIARHCPRMEYVELKRNAVTYDGFQALARACPLREMNLGWFKYVPGWSQAVVRLLAHCPHLRILETYEERLKDTVLHAIAAHCPELTSLSIGSCKLVTYAGVIAVVEACPQISRLDLSGCNKLTDAALYKIATYCKQLTWFRCDGDCLRINSAGVRAIVQGVRCCDTSHTAPTTCPQARRRTPARHSEATRAFMPI
jgi:hypothetical protein